MYLQMGKFNKAEQTYREDLKVFPKNGFALNGLQHALRGMNKLDEAAHVQKQYKEAWKNADMDLKYSRIDQGKRKNLAINLSRDSPNNLIYIAGTFCSIN